MQQSALSVRERSQAIRRAGNQ